MLGVSVTSALIVLLAVIGTSSIMINESATKQPLMFSKWPPSYQNSKSQSLRQQIFHQLRSSGRIPSPSMIVKRYPSSMPIMMRPMKYAQLKKTPIPQPSYYRPTISTPPRYRFHSSAQAPNTGEYIFENPFNNMGLSQNKKKFSMTDDTKYNPIHTVQAPNLNKNLAYSTHNEFMHEPFDNSIFDQKEHFNQITFRPLTIPQYQVTEQINDHTIRVDPFTGKQKFYAPDPDQSVPNYKIAQAFDSFNQPNAVASRPYPIEISFVPQQNQGNTGPVAAPLIQLSNQVPQQQLPDTYALPIGNQPQLQQHLLQQQTMLQNMPVSVYNPTYLVTQSNNLLKQHREQLFKPAPAYLGSINQPTIDLSPRNSQPLQDVDSAASPGQLLTSAQSQQKQQAQQPPSALQEPSQPNGVPLRTDFQSSLPQTDHSQTFQNENSQTFQNGNSPTFQRYIADRPPSIVFAQQPQLTESELNNLLNIGQQDPDDSTRFIASTYYHAHPDPQVEIENRHRQQLNDITIAKANEEAKIGSAEVTKVTIGRKPTAHQEHQQKLAEQFSGKSPLRIYVPDEEYQKKNEVRRSDFFRPESKHDFFASKTDYSRNNQYLSYNDQDEDGDDDNTTTDSGEDYLAHDTESVDRLALDGETRDPRDPRDPREPRGPIHSSTIDSYNF